MKLNWLRKDSAEEIQCREGDVPYLYFPILEDTGMVHHGFSTKLGGVSEGCYASMNLRVNSDDRRENILENFHRIAEAIGFEEKKLVLTHQTHTTNIRVVTAEDAGKGLYVPRDYEDIDGCITNVPGITLAAFFADCVPLYFVDPVKRAIGLSHSGWRGTVNRMGRCTIEAMREICGSRPEDIIACVGPSICGDCYEVGEEVAEQFVKAFGLTCDEAESSSSYIHYGKILTKKPDGKYLLNLWEANRQVLSEAGILPEHLVVGNICTKCNHELLYSHRVTGFARGNLAAFLGIKEV